MSRRASRAANAAARCGGASMSVPVAPPRGQVAYERIKSDIFDFRLLPGDRFSEPEIAERFGMSRTPVREALLRLEREGYVTVAQRSGWQVRPLDFKAFDEFYDVRLILESAAIRRVCELDPQPPLTACAKLGSHRATSGSAIRAPSASSTRRFTRRWSPPPGIDSYLACTAKSPSASGSSAASISPARADSRNLSGARADPSPRTATAGRFRAVAAALAHRGQQGRSAQDHAAHAVRGAPRATDAGRRGALGATPSGWAGTPTTPWRTAPRRSRGASHAPRARP